MDKPVKIFTALIGILIFSVFFAGCTGSSGATNSTTPNSTQPATTISGVLYTAGDIVRSPSGSTSTGWLILSYDPATDMYSRAFIYQNSDGTWGYRANSNTETAARKGMEKVYTVRITRVSVSSVPVKTATAAVTSTRSVTSSAGSSTTTTPVTATTTAGKPSFTSITPEDGYAGTTVSITDLVGSNFQSGATVALVYSGSPNITATNVQWVSSSHMTCTFTIPSNVTISTWDILITNPDGQYVKYNTYFGIHESTSATATETTSPTESVVITSVDPIIVYAGVGQGFVRLTIYTTTNIQIGATAKLVNSQGQEIAGGDSMISSSLISMQVPFTIPAGSQGQWNVVLTNPDGTMGTLTNGFTVN